MLLAREVHFDKLQKIMKILNLKRSKLFMPISSTRS
jgi:hypothetical protein